MGRIDLTLACTGRHLPGVLVNDISGLGAIRNLDYTVLLCDDIEVMRRFYTEVMGLEIRHEIPER